MAAPRGVVCSDGKGGKRLIETFCVVFYQITASKLIKLIRSGPSTRPPRLRTNPPYTAIRELWNVEVTASNV
jgi:hypothetical protein